MVGNELIYIQKAAENMHLSGDGAFTERCHTWLETNIGCKRALLTHSCTGALEMAAMLAEIRQGDEIIMPSFTFVSTANAFVLRGGVPVFVDIRPDTLCIDENLIEGAITRKTKAIVVVHYAGMSCEMDIIENIAMRYGLLVIEDAAQGICSSYNGRPLGSMGSMSAISFHETKNVISGEGGCLLLNESRWIDRAEIIREKGTDRKKFFRGEVEKYTWVDIGSSYLPSDITAAFLYAQLENAFDVVRLRLKIWQMYHQGFKELEQNGHLRRPIVPAGCQHNGHLYYLLLPDRMIREHILMHLRKNNINGVFHYVPLHSSPAGLRYGRAVGKLSQTEKASACLLRLPVWVGMQEMHVAKVVSKVMQAISQCSGSKSSV